MKTENTVEIQRQVVRLWQRLRLTDRRRLSHQYRTFHSKLQEDRTFAVEKLLPVLLERLNEAEKHSLVRYAKSLRCEFSEDLPITAKIPEIRSSLKEHQVVIVCGATGSGKTTQLPKAALLEGFGRVGRIGCTQPRRLAATALAARLANELKVSSGNEVGYQVRFDDRTNESTVIKFMTDGILLAETRSDPLLLQYDCLILDEVHERSLNIDFLLGYLKRLLEKRKNLHVIISSATLEAGKISGFFSDAPIIEVEGKLFPIEDIWQEREEDEELSTAIDRAIVRAIEYGRDGDILIFLPGEREIRESADLLESRHYPHTEILPLFGRLSAGEQNRIFQHSGKRRIILSTNVAETSLTIPGIRFVVDSGLVRLSRFNPKSGIQELRLEFISKASARQRRGRCGRVGEGVCIHLYAESELENADDYTAPEIQRAGLAGVILQMESLRLPAIEIFPFVDPPSAALIHEGRMTLRDIGAIDENSHLTRIGSELAELPVGPVLGKMLLMSKDKGFLPEMLILAAYLSVQDPRERPFEHRKEAETAQRQFDVEGSDFLSALKLWREMGKALSQSRTACRTFARKNYLSYRRLTEWRNLAGDLAELLDADVTMEELTVLQREVNWDELHQTLMSAMPRRLGMYDSEKKCYIDRNGRQFQIFPGSVLSKAESAPKWLLSFMIVETTRAYARCNAVVNGAWLESAAPHVCTKTYDNINWDEISGFVRAREKVMAGQLPIHPGRNCHYGRINALKAREVFIEEALSTGRLTVPDVPWVVSFQKRYNEIEELEIRYRHPGYLLNRTGVKQYFLNVLPLEICSVDAVRRDYKRNRRSYLPDENEMVYSPDDLSEKNLFPECIVQSGQTFPLRYHFAPGESHDGISVIVQESDYSLLSSSFLSWLVPGFLPWKIECLLRSLPKNIRKELIPLSGCVQTFMEELKAGHIFTDQPFFDALKEFLLADYGVVVSSDDFSSCNLDEFLKMKLFVVDESGKHLKTLYEVPSGLNAGSVISRTHPVSRNYHAENCRKWPENFPLPEEVPVSPDGTKVAFPALRDEKKSVGISLYLNRSEAVVSHSEGLRRFVKIQYPQMQKSLSSMLKLPYDMELSLFPEDPQWRESMLNYALDHAWPQSPWKIRSADDYDNSIEYLRDHAASALQETLLLLKSVYSEYKRAKEKLNRIKPDTSSYIDAESQINFLLRPGFLYAEEAVRNYCRYFKSLTIRLERATLDLQKDELKMDPISKYIEQFQMAAYNLDEPLEYHPFFYRYFLLLEEGRIGAFTPEIKTTCKATPAILEELWKSKL